MVFMSVLAAGFAAAERYARTEKELILLLDFFTDFGNRLRLMRASPGSITNELMQRKDFSQNKFLAALSRELAKEISFADALIGSCGLLEKGTEKAVGAQLRTLAGYIGVSPLSEQLPAIEVCCARLEKAAAAAGEDAGKYGELYRRLGALGGLLAAVIFI